MENRSDRFTANEERYSGYTVVDEGGSKIGKVDDLFLDENDQPEYFGVKTGFLGTSSTLIPADVTTTDEANQTISVSSDKNTVKDGPAFDDDREITPEYENEVRSYYGLGSVDPPRIAAHTATTTASTPAREPQAPPLPARSARA
jgi:PRC-barrel domain